MSNIELVEDAQQKYRECGFLVFACRFPHEIGDVLYIEDAYLAQTETKWRVISESCRQEFIQHGAVYSTDRPYFYRAEAMD